MKMLSITTRVDVHNLTSSTLKKEMPLEKVLLLTDGTPAMNMKLQGFVARQTLIHTSRVCSDKIHSNQT
jgi:hypothetical protein